MKNLKRLFIIVVLISIIGVIIYNKNNIYINTVLKTPSYSYLSKEAQEYIKEKYQETGNLILTEKNKEDNKLYLNPAYIDYLSYTEKEKEEVAEIPIALITDYTIKELTSTGPIPSSYNLNDYVTPIRNQGRLGLCWAFATAGALESHLLKTTDTAYTSSSQLISERQIDYATSRNGIKNYKNEYTSFIKRSLGDGGNFYISTIALANGISGIDYNNFKTYKDSDLSKMELHEVLNHDNSLYELNSTTNMPFNTLRESSGTLTNEEKTIRNNYLNQVKQKILDKGAAYVSTYMNSGCQIEDSNLNNIVIDVYNCNRSGGHAMEIIGWDDNYEYEYCADTLVHNKDVTNCKNTVSGKGVWILKNSWGEDNTPNPFLAYDSMYTNIHFIDEVLPKADKNWDNNYIVGSEEEGIETITFNLNKTKIKNNEIIKKVKFITQTSNSEYNVKIKKLDGTYKTISKSNTLPGLITIDIDNNIEVTKDTEITISSSDGSFIDKISLFTSNKTSAPQIDVEKLNNIKITYDTLRLYSETKNIPSNANLIYKIYNSNNQLINSISITNNTVAENNINTLATFPSNLASDTYRVDIEYNSNIVDTFNIIIENMEGSGTKNDPYIITTTSQLYQIRYNPAAHYELGNDIDLTEDTRENGLLSKESETCPQGFGWEAINDFSGTLDGKNHKIIGLYQNNYLECNVDGDPWISFNDTGNGLFGNIKGDITIKNLILENFDINCQGYSCGLLASKYIGNMNESGVIDWSDKLPYTAKFENIAVINSKISGSYNRYNRDNHQYGGGLFGTMENQNTNSEINISNVYIDINRDTKQIKRSSILSSYIYADTLNINNIRLLGPVNGKYDDGSGDAVLTYTISTNNLNVENIISTVDANNVSGILLGSVSSTNSNIDRINAFNVEGKTLCSQYDCQNTTNINIFNKENQLDEFTKSTNYTGWSNFNTNWEIRTIDGVKRIPALKFMNFEYTNIPDIEINQELNKKYYIYDYINPNIDAAKQITFESNNENIVKLNEYGLIIPQKSGSGTIHIESFYDGYINDVPIEITYTPHYTVSFDANGGEGEMESIEVPAGENYTIPENEFERDNYEFNGWNTKADGSGNHYDNLGQIPGRSDKNDITLYAEWLGEKRVITFDPQGGEVNPTQKIIRVGEPYGDLPIPTKENYGFIEWKAIISESVVATVDSTKTFAYYPKLKAHWVSNAYTIIYDANGGKIDDENIDLNGVYILSNKLTSGYGYNDRTKELSNNIYKKNGYSFKEWNTKADGTGITYTEGQTIDQSHVTNSQIRLYAIWEKDEKPVSLSKDKVYLTPNTSKIIVSEINTSIPNTYTTDNIEWTSNDTNIATVVNGTITGINVGETTITARLPIGKETTLQVIVEETPREIIKGDYDFNGTVEVSDILATLKKVFGYIPKDGEDIQILDVTNDNQIGPEDIIKILKYIFEYIDEL